MSDPKPIYNPPIMRHFRFDHLPQNLGEVSEKFYDLANYIAVHIGNGPERQVALRKLLEAKDAAVRAKLEES